MSNEFSNYIMSFHEYYGYEKRQMMLLNTRLLSKYVFSAFLKEFKLELLRMSSGSSFHCLAADIVNEFSKKLVLELGTRSKSLSTERKFRICESDTLVKMSLIYSGAKLFKAL